MTAHKNWKCTINGKACVGTSVSDCSTACYAIAEGKRKQLKRTEEIVASQNNNGGPVKGA